MNTLRRYAREFGALRITMWLLAMVALFLIPSPGARAVYDGWPLVTTVLVPVVTPMLFLGLLLDALMSRVFMADAEGEARRRLKRIMLINLIAAALLVARWLPFYAALRV